MDKPELKTIPLSPGVYLFKNQQGRVIYVGKAKALRKRLASYFRPVASLPLKTQLMISEATEYETISTSTENEALLLEASLIKKHRPRYNIILRDDKDYVLFRIDTSVPFPRLEIVRQIRRSKNRSNTFIFGPYSSGRDAKSTWKAIHKIFPLRRCSERNFKNRTRPCLYHHMQQCLGPCVLPINKEQYEKIYRQVIMLLQGRSKDLLLMLQKEMEGYSELLEFEKAAELRDQIKAIQNTIEKQSVVLAEEDDLDILGVAEAEGGLSLGLLFVRGGALIGSRSFFWSGLKLEDSAELFCSFLIQFYSTAESIPPRIVLPWLPVAPENKHSADQDENIEDSYFGKLQSIRALLGELRGTPVRIAAPKGEDELKLVTLAATNAKEDAILKQHVDYAGLLATALHSSEPVERIEAVDVSHTSGSATRAGMVVFESGHPLKSEWRSYSFTEQNGDDYAVLAAWAERRIASGPPWPDLLLIDGGRGQLNVVNAVFAKYGLDTTIKLAAIAKARNEDGSSDRRAGNISDRIFMPGRSNPLNIKPGAPELLYLQHIRNQVHDFSLVKHRKARTNQAFVGELNRIPGFGPKLIRALWEKFNSLTEMAKADEKALRTVPGMGKQRILQLREHLNLILEKIKK